MVDFYTEWKSYILFLFCTKEHAIIHLHLFNDDDLKDQVIKMTVVLVVI